MFPCLGVSAFSGRCGLRTDSTHIRVFDKNPFTRKLSPRTGDYKDERSFFSFSNLKLYPYRMVNQPVLSLSIIDT